MTTTPTPISQAFDTVAAWEALPLKSSTADRVYEVCTAVLHIDPQSFDFDRVVDRLIEQECEGDSPMTLALLVIDLIQVAS